MHWGKTILYLLLGSVLPSLACTRAQSVQDPEPAGNNGRPYSQQLYLRREGDNLYLSAKMDRRTDIIYWFKPCMFNELYTFYRVGITPNNDALPTTHPEIAPQTILNLAYSDNIGPFAIAGCGWCGANHKYKERSARTAYNKSFEIRADHKPIERDTALWANSVVVESINMILDPSRPTFDGSADEVLREPLCEEQVLHRIDRNNIEVRVSHRFINPTPVTIAIYYGMQSMFEKETEIFTSGGAYSDWTPTTSVSEFHKREYPTFRRYLERNKSAYQATYLLPEGLGDHAQLGDGEVVFINASYGKTYHKLLANEPVEAGKGIHWGGVYTWFTTPFVDDSELLCYEGILHGKIALFIDCKRPCNRTLTLPNYLHTKDYHTVESNGRIIVTPLSSQQLNITAEESGACILQLQ